MDKHELGVALGKLRWQGKTKAERAAHMKMMSLKAAKKRKKKKPKKHLDT